MFFYSFLKYYSIVCLDFFPWDGGFFDTFDWPFVSHPGEFDQKILKFVKSPPLARNSPPPTGFTLIGALIKYLSEVSSICQMLASVK